MSTMRSASSASRSRGTSASPAPATMSAFLTEPEAVAGQLSSIGQNRPWPSIVGRPAAAGALLVAQTFLTCARRAVGPKGTGSGLLGVGCLYVAWFRRTFSSSGPCLPRVSGGS